MLYVSICSIKHNSLSVVFECFGLFRLVQGVHTRVVENSVKPMQGVHLNSV
jgi:hypothetical protein